MAKSGNSKSSPTAESNSTGENEKTSKNKASLLSDQVIRMSSVTYQKTKLIKGDEEMLRGENNVIIVRRKRLDKKTNGQKQSRRVLVYFAIEGKWKEVNVENLS